MAKAPKDYAGPTALKIAKMRPGDAWGSNRPSVWDSHKSSDIPFQNYLDFEKGRGPGDSLHQREEEDATGLYLKGGKVKPFATGGSAANMYTKDYSKRRK